MNPNSDEVIYKMMVMSLEDKIKELSKIMEVQQNVLGKVVSQMSENLNELIKYKEKYGEL
jgi:hypothetical protein